MLSVPAVYPIIIQRIHFSGALKSLINRLFILRDVTLSPSRFIFSKAKLRNLLDMIMIHIGHIQMSLYLWIIVLYHYVIYKFVKYKH